MAVGVMQAVFNTALPPKEKFLAVILADSADGYGRNISPSVAYFARMTSFTERSVRRIMARLCERGVLVPDGAHPTRGTPTYRLAIAGLEVPTAVTAKEPCCPRKLRRECIEVFNRTCSYCGGRGDGEHGPDGAAWNIDRLVPGKHGGAYDPLNITLSCERCNRVKRTQSAPSGTRTLADRRALSVATEVPATRQ